MTLLLESIVLCILFTLAISLISREPIRNLYNYPPQIQERVKMLEEYRDRIPTGEKKIVKKLAAVVVIVVLFSLILRYINGYRTFLNGFAYAFLLWSVINFYDFIVLDVIWFCHDPHFVLKGTEDMTEAYHDYLFHFKGFLIGECLALVVCVAVGFLVTLLP
ncbi:MAG: hypothetical protein IJI44_03110 [Erysipelotrichaceae bacterium]|nr:hypothetical protein [Erysipelotrichaceae bacterium]